MRDLMRRRRATARDRGAATMVVAMFVGVGVLFGFGAVVIDVGRLYTEREELQSGADSAAHAVARLCSAGHCPTDPVAVARTYAGRNAKDGVSDVAVCGAGINGLPACPVTATTKLSACIGAAPGSGTRYVEVRTTTRNGDNTTVVPPVLARTLNGNSKYSGTKVAACARASVTPGMVGRVWEANMITLTVNVCYWSMYTVNGSAYPAPPGGVPPASKEQILYLKDSRPNGDGKDGKTTYCPGNLGDKNAPGNWGWLDDTTSPQDCRGRVTTGNTVSADPGNNTPKGCESLLGSLRTSRAPLMIPLFDSVSGNGNNTKYHIAGIGAFVVTGYFLTGNVDEKSWLSGKALCSGSERCIYGYFTDATFTDDVLKVENGTDFGANTSKPPVVKLIG